MDPEGLDVGLGEVFVEFPVAVNNRDINITGCLHILLYPLRDEFAF